MNPKKPAESLTSRMLSASVGPQGSVAVKPRCAARCKATGERCRKYPMHGGRVCGSHGGSAGQVRAAAQRRLQARAVEAEVDAELAYQQVEAVSNPLEELSLLAGEALMLKEAMAARVNALKSLSYSAAGSGTEQLRSEVALYERALDRTARFLDLLVKSGFEEKRIALDAARAAVLIQVLDRIFDRLELSDAQRVLIGTVVPQEFRAIAAEPHR
jgi:hypothetical protein